MVLLEKHTERSGYLLKERIKDVAVVLDALERIDEGECVLDPTIVSRLVGGAREQSLLDELTPREREVLAPSGAELREVRPGKGEAFVEAQFECERCCTIAVLVVAVGEPAGIVQDRERLHDERVRAGGLGRGPATSFGHASPVVGGRRA